MWKAVLAITLVSAAIIFVIGLQGSGNIGVVSHGQQASVNNALGGTNSAPGIVLDKLGGGTINLSDYRGKKPVVVDFWASWCPNCRRDMPNLNRFYEKYKDQAEVVGINLQEDSNTVASFIASRGISFPIALDPSGSASQAFGIQYTNTHVLINKNGDVVRSIPGDISEPDIQSLIALNAPPSNQAGNPQK